jgi:beta-N-acetylhexosaminidase
VPVLFDSFRVQESSPPPHLKITQLASPIAHNQGGILAGIDARPELGVSGQAVEMSRNPPEMATVHVSNDGQEMHRGCGWVIGAAVGNLEPDTLNQGVRKLAFAGPDRRKLHPPKAYPGKTGTANTPQDLSRVQPWRADLLEWGIGSPAHRQVRPLEQAESWIMKQALHRAQVRARWDEWKPSFVDNLGPAPAAHRDHDRRRETEISRRKPDKLTQGHPVTHRDREAANRRTKRCIQHVSLDQCADWVGPIQNDHWKSASSRGLHDVDRGGQVGVVACADILQIDQHDIDSPQHLRCRGRSPAVKAIDWKPGGRIFRGRNCGARIGCPPESMLGAEQCYELDAGRPQSNHVADPLRVHAGLVCHQAYPTVTHKVKTVGQQELETRASPGRRRARSGAVGRFRARTAGTTDGPPQQSQQGERSVQSKYLVLAVVLLCACGRAGPVPVPQPAQFPLQGTPAPVDIDAVLGSLSVRDKIAQLVMPWIPGTYAAFDDDAFRRMQQWVDSLHVGGLLISVGSPLDVAAKLNRLQQRSPLPLLVASDLEAGTAIRLNGGTPFPPNMGIGATGSDSDAYEIGKITALEGRAVGIHLAFAPVADVNNNPANPIINVRSFGEDPHAVGRLVAAEIRGLQEHGMLASAKHFPGHGDTGADSHIALPVFTPGWPRLDSVELVPFRSAIAAGVTVVMSAHIALPGIDGGLLRPGTIAPNILTGLLRDSLGFRGLVVTDALNMGGIANGYGTEAAVRAFLAGSDLLVQPADPKTTIDAMMAAVSRREISPERLDRSVRRILELKQKLGLFVQRITPLDSIPEVVGRAEFKQEALDMAARSVVLVKDVNGTVHGLKNARQPLSVITYGDDNNRSVGNVVVSELRTRGFGVSTFKLWPSSGPASYDSAFSVIERSPIAVFAVADKPTEGRGKLGLPDSMLALISNTARARPTVLLSLGNPYLISDVPEVGSYLIGWRSNSVIEQAVARALAGVASITGRLPISIPPSFPLGWGLQRRVP